MSQGRKRAKKRKRSTVQVLNLAPTALNVEHPDAHKRRALAAFLKHGTVAAACNGARPRIGRSTFYEWAQADAQFRELFLAAQHDVTDRIEQASIKRAVAGSDTLAIFLLKKRRPETYADRITLTEFSPELVLKVQQQLQLIASQSTWDSEELITRLSVEVWNK